MVARDVPCLVLPHYSGTALPYLSDWYSPSAFSLCRFPHGELHGKRCSSGTGLGSRAVAHRYWGAHRTHNKAPCHVARHSAG